jgi:hypothetical protein
MNFGEKISNPLKPCEINLKMAIQNSPIYTSNSTSDMLIPINEKNAVKQQIWSKK